MRKLALGLAVLGAVAAAIAIVLRRRDGVPATDVSTTESVVSERSLETMTRDELYELAQKHNIPGRSKMKKDDLIAALNGAKRSG